MEVAEATEGPGELRPPEQTLAEALKSISPRGAEPAGQEGLHQHCPLTRSSCSQWSSIHSLDLQGQEEEEEEEVVAGKGHGPLLSDHESAAEQLPRLWLAAAPAAVATEA